ncbi:MAG: aspartate/glutamate racemase family protein, partial [Tannerella sp.]|nr:aspartate/glutamate racemase family protein [Tannerella sp.]
MIKKSSILIAFLISLAANAQVRFDADFESGSIGHVTLIDSVTIQTSGTDSVLHLSYIVESRFDPLNPVDTALPPSARWFYFRVTGVQNKYIYFDLKNTDPLRAVYSCDNKEFKRFNESDARLGRISKYFDRDTAYIAYFVPYTNAFLQERIAQWQQHKDVNVQTFGRSFHNRPMQLLTITDQTVSDENKIRVWMHARTHTSETPGSWQLDGLIESLLSDNADARAYRKAFVFYIVPFVNPDGVAEGLSRSNSLGVNQEINWDRNDSLTVVEVKNLKRQLTELTANRKLDLALNIHSQINNSATYWVHTAGSTNDRFLCKELLLSYRTMFDNSYLAPGELSFSRVAPRYPEGWFWDKFGDQTLAVTIETPYTYYGASDIWVDTQNLRDFGKATLHAIAMYFGVSTPDRILLDNESAKAKGRWEKVESAGKVYLGDNYVSAQKANSKLTYQYKNLPAGNYQVYRWSVGESSENPAYDSNKWVPAGAHTQKKTSKFKYRLTAGKPGEIFDAIMLVKDPVLPVQPSNPTSLIPVSHKALTDKSSIYYTHFSAYPAERKNLPIGVFDSGTGGLTVLESMLVMDRFNNKTGEPEADGIPDFACENFTYLADQANMPYGRYAAENKSAYLEELAVKDALFMLNDRFFTRANETKPAGKKERAKIVVIACNTATAYGLKDIEQLLDSSRTQVHVIGVVNAGVNGAIEHIKGAETAAVGVMATPGTISSGSYERTLRAVLEASHLPIPLEVINQSGAGFAEAVDGEKDFVEKGLTAPRSSYRGPSLGTGADDIDPEWMDVYRFDTANGALLCERKGDSLTCVQLNSAANYARFHLVSLFEQYR